MKFKTVIINNIDKLQTNDLLDIRNAIDAYLGGDDLQIIASRMISEGQFLQAVKYVKEKNNWSLLQAKEYCDKIKYA